MTEVRNQEKRKKRIPSEISVCPKCGFIHPKWTFAGKANSGKPMIRCSNCRHRITVDYGQLTYYSHQNEEKWKQMIDDTVSLHPAEETAQKLGVSRTTVKRMRSRWLASSKTDR